ncbi:MAG: hypothetical protein CL521_00045 [Actinobacteria bacterium]|nr:hypothetical protein [Actinomycetota bacterium]
MKSLIQKSVTLIYDFPKFSLTFFFGFFFLATTQLTHIELDSSLENFLYPSDPAKQVYDSFRDEFGRDEQVIILLKPDSLFDTDFLRTLVEIHYELEEKVPYLSEITSLVNVRDIQSKNDELVVDSLLENIPSTDSELRQLKDKVMSHSLYQHYLVSEDAQYTAILLKTSAYSYDAFLGDDINDFESQLTDSSLKDKRFISDRENAEVVDSIQSVLKAYQSEQLDVYLAGTPYMVDELNSSMQSDLRLFLSLAFLIIGLILWILFKRFIGIFLPLLVVLFSLVLTISFMGFLGLPIQIITQILPSFLICVGVADALHVLAVFFREYDQGYSKRDAVLKAFHHSGMPILLTTLTTCGGLLALMSADLLPIAELGFIAASGVMLAFLLTVFLVPSFLAILPVTRPTRQQQIQNMSRFLRQIGLFSVRHYKSILFGVVLLLILSVFGLKSLRFAHNPLSWFQPEHHIRQNTQLIDQFLKGSVVAELYIDTGVQDGVYDPQFLEKLGQLHHYMESVRQDNIEVFKSLSIVTLIKEIHQVLLPYSERSFPNTSEGVAQELLLFETSGNNDRDVYIDVNNQKVRLTVMLPWVDAMAYTRLMDDITPGINDILGPELRYNVTGLMSILMQTVSKVITSMAKSYIIAGVVISLLMMLLLQHVGLGLLSMIPNFLPIMFILSIMGVLGIPLDLSNILVGSIAIGLVVDDTIHFLYQYREQFNRYKDVPKAIEETLVHCGQALLYTTIILSLAFFIFMFADMINLIRFGFLTGLTIILALLADFILVPSMLMLGHHFRKQRS